MKTKAVTEFDILEGVVTRAGRDFSPEGAKSLLQLTFDAKTTNTIRRLLRKNNRGTITAVERIELEQYLRVGQLLDLLHAEARLSLEPRHGAG